MNNGIAIKGYYVQSGYMGWVDNHYMLFATESEYIEYVTN